VSAVVRDASSTPRRMTPERRRAQLASAALAELARGGYEALSLEAVARRAGVTRNLLYHYFPRGRIDLLHAAVERAGQELTDDWSLDESVPLPQRLAQNFARMADHAAAPSDAWVARRFGAASRDPEVRAVHDRYRRRVVDAIAVNNLGTADVPPLVRASLEAYLSFAEALLDRMRESRLPREQVVGVLAEILAATAKAARA
jgi:AcrR family transcriptional regulator